MRPTRALKGQRAGSAMRRVRESGRNTYVRKILFPKSSSSQGHLLEIALRHHDLATAALQDLGDEGRSALALGNEPLHVVKMCVTSSNQHGGEKK